MTIARDDDSTQTTDDALLLTSALDYARRGWPVFPLHHPVNGHCSCGKSDCSNIGKHPRYYKA
jgi:hypothetical protein